MNDATRNKIKSALESTQRFIDLESKRSGDLRSLQVQDLLEWHIQHKKKLLSMLEGN